MDSTQGVNNQVFQPSCGLKMVFWALVGAVLMIVLLISGRPLLFKDPESWQCFRPYWIAFFFTAIAALFILGLALIVMARRQTLEVKLRKYLLLTGLATAGFPACVILHNLVYGLFIVLFGADFWERIGLGDEPVLFLLAIFVCPIAFLIGVVGSAILLLKRRDKQI